MTAPLFDWTGFRTHAPNLLQTIPVSLIEPSRENVRLFNERESREKLRGVYAAHAAGADVILPDAPILRFLGWHNFTPTLELLAGERRVTSAKEARLTLLDCRVVTMDDEDAYQFILDHNDVAGLTTAELSFRAAEMERLGFSSDKISEALKGAAPHRYVAVGKLLNPDLFTDAQKRCDPSIIEWFECAKFGPDHFTECFLAWDAGLWDAKTCAQRFRKRGVAMPLDNAEKGIRVTLDGHRMVIRGQIDLTLVTPRVAAKMADRLVEMLDGAMDSVEAGGEFSFEKEIYQINPLTVS